MLLICLFYLFVSRILYFIFVFSLLCFYLCAFMFVCLSLRFFVVVFLPVSSVGPIPDQVKLKTIKLVFVASALSPQR